MVLFFTCPVAFSGISFGQKNFKKIFLKNNLSHSIQFQAINGLCLNTIKFNEVEKHNTNIIVQKKDTLYMLFFLLTLTTIFFIYVVAASIYIMRNKSKMLLGRKNKELIKLNMLLIHANKEKELLLKETHHRFKNNLQLVMSLFNIQAQDPKEFQLDDFIEKGRSRITAMALIHQSLSQTESYTHIEFEMYLTNLVENINTTYSVNNVDFEIITNDNHFNLDTSIPLGLIINELINNALKYAFPTNVKGKIKLEIIKKSIDTFELIIEDNGIGFIKKDKNSKSIGLELISLLTAQLNGKIKKGNQKGTNYSIEFKEILNKYTAL
jgi:two-component sensor histidine kinase